MTQTITQAPNEATKEAMMAVREAEDPTKSRRSVQAVPRASAPLLGQPIPLIKRFQIRIMNQAI